MPILLRNIRLALDEPEEVLLTAVSRRLSVPLAAIRAYAVVRRSLDARRQDDIHFTHQVELDLDESPASQQARLRRLGRGDTVWLESRVAQTPVCGPRELGCRPVIIGLGPGGMFAALRLAEFGYRPIVFERGRDVKRRHRDIMQRYYQDRDFDPTSNLLFGEGGAGTYSDGKLYTRINDPLCRSVLETFYRHGAAPDILVDARPHIGSDCLPSICTRIRERIESLGGEVRFECQMDDIRIVDGRVEAVHVTSTGRTDDPGSVADLGADDVWWPAEVCLLATGHSARDTIRMLHAHGVRIEPKPFQVGVRIEHPQAMVDTWQYGSAAGHQRLGPAEYHIVAKQAAGEQGDVFSFCMCPGGVILPTNESPGLIATNGASRSQRSGPFANSGLVISLDPEWLDQGSKAAASGSAAVAMAGLDYLERLERLAFESTGGSYEVPLQRAYDFLNGRRSQGTVETSYPLGGRWSEVARLLPDVVTAALRRALPMFESRYRGFAGREALITVPETRASGPIRLSRDKETREADGTAGLYPVGEGAGYAGGIVSAAVDGIKSADAIIRCYAPPR